MKVLACDYDDTLFVNNTICETDLKAIREFQAQGHWFGLCSGRHVDSLQVEIKKYKLVCDFLIANNGTFILDKQYQPLYKAQFEQSWALKTKAILQQLYAKDIYWLALNDGYTFGRVFFQSGSKFLVHEKTTFEQMLTKECSTMFFEVVDKTKTKAISDHLNEIFASQLYFYPNHEFVDITRQPIDKGEGIMFLSDHYQLKQENIYVVGDSYNDISMFKKFHSFVMETSHQSIKKHAKHETKSVKQVIDYIRRAS